MAIEIRVLTGARAGQVRRFEQPVVVVGRQAGLDLRFDPQQDLDVSGRHAEIRAGDAGTYVIQDTNSTNGTFVNGQRITDVVTLREGDKVRFGAKGPEAEIHLAVDAVEAIRPTPPKNTEQRIAIAVSKQTAGMKRALLGAGVLIVLGGAGAAYYAKQQSAQRVEELRNIVSTQGSGVDQQTRMAEIFTQNSGAVAIIVTQIDGKNFTGSGFSISQDGIIVTNRHNVVMDGKSATRIAVKFTDTPDWLPAEVLKISDDPDVDVALLRMTRADKYPSVRGVSATSSGASEGTAVLSIGYPLGYDTPMEGPAENFIAKSTLNPGTVSKRTSSVLQIDSYATHGSSGSPVFNLRGQVVGLVYGGARDAAGKIVYAVPAEKIAAFVPAEYRAIVKD